MALVLLVVAPERFRDEELFDTQAELTQAGHQTVVVSTRAGLCPGSRGGQVLAELMAICLAPVILAYAGVLTGR